jgi:hypothetical protein
MDWFYTYLKVTAYGGGGVFGSIGFLFGVVDSIHYLGHENVKDITCHTAKYTLSGVIIGVIFGPIVPPVTAYISVREIFKRISI